MNISLLKTVLNDPLINFNYLFLNKFMIFSLNNIKKILVWSLQTFTRSWEARLTELNDHIIMFSMTRIDIIDTAFWIWSKKIFSKLISLLTYHPKRRTSYQAVHLSNIYKSSWSIRDLSRKTRGRLKSLTFYLPEIGNRQLHIYWSFIVFYLNLF